MGWKKKSMKGVGRINAMTMFCAQVPCHRSIRLTTVFARFAKSSSVGVVSSLRYQPGESLDTGRERVEDVEDVRACKEGRVGGGRPMMDARDLGTMDSMAYAVRPLSTSEVVFIFDVWWKS